MNTSTRSHLSGLSSRRTFLRGAAITAAGAATIAAAGVPRGASAEGIGPIVFPKPPVEIVKTESTIAGKHVVERVGGLVAGQADTWRPTGHFWLKNNGDKGYKLIKVRVSYTGAGAPAPFEQDTYQWIGIAGPVVREIPEPRLHGFPIAETMRITCFFEGWVSGVTYEVPLSEYLNQEPGGAYDFPGKASELPFGQYWFAGDNHGFGCKHVENHSQRFAYDLGVMRWDGKTWNDKRAPKHARDIVDGSKNDHFNIWGVPVYAVTGGTITEGYRLNPDNSKPGADDSGGMGGNRLWIQSETGDEYSGGFFLYAHLQAGSIPPELVPVEGGGGVKVQKGQFLGLVGNSGSSSAPHLHIHFQRGKGEADWAQGLPLRFKNTRYRGYEDFVPNWLESGQWNQNLTNAAVPNRSLISADGPALMPELRLLF